MAQRVVVMYGGQQGRGGAGRSAVRQAAPPLHAAPCSAPCRGWAPRSRTTDKARLAEIPGVVPSLKEGIAGCIFAPRCAHATLAVPGELSAAGGEGRGPLGRVLGSRPDRGGGGMSATPVLEVKNLKKHFPVRKGIFSRLSAKVYAVDGISFAIKGGETLGLVGESGCGKSTAGKLILKLIEPTAGEISLDGARIEQLSRADMRPYRQDLQVVFQDPYSSLNPRMRARDIVAEPMHEFRTRLEIRDRGAGRDAVREGRPAPRPDDPLSARVLRRPAPASRDRPRPGPAPQADRVRRGRLRARRLGAGAGDQPAGRPAARLRRGLSVHRA